MKMQIVKKRDAEATCRKHKIDFNERKLVHQNMFNVSLPKKTLPQFKQSGQKTCQKTQSTQKQNNQQDTLLIGTEAALEHNLASTNHVILKAGRLYSQNWKTTCLTWLLLFVVCGLFLFMVFIIRVT